jgi:hypothetical protein
VKGDSHEIQKRLPQPRGGWAGQQRGRRATAAPAKSDLQVDNVILIVSDSLRRDALSCYRKDWIPLLVYFPGCRGGSRVNALVQSVDLMPTVLDLMRVARPKPVQSESFVPLLTGRVSKLRDLVVGSPLLLESRENPPTPDSRSSITDGEWLLIQGARASSGAGVTRSAAVDSRIREVKIMQGDIRPELYHLTEDAGCEKNRITEKGGTARNLQAAYFEFLRKTRYPEDRLKYFQRL